MSPISYTRSLLKVSVGQILQTVGFQTVQASALDILVEILERYIYLLSKTSHDYAELANRTEPCLDDVARAFDKHKVSIADLEEYIKYVDTPEFELKKHISKSVYDADKEERFIPEDVKKRAKSKQKQKSYADYLGYCSDPYNKELLERQSDEENEHIYDFMPLMTLDKQKIQEAEIILNQSNQNTSEEFNKDSLQSQQSDFIVKNGQKFKNTSWKSVYEPKFLFKNRIDKENMHEKSSEQIEVETKSRTPIGPSAMLPRYAHKPKSKYKRLIYTNAVNFCNKSIAGTNIPTEIVEQFDTKKFEVEQTNTEMISIEKLDETKVVKIEETNEKVKPIAKTVSIVDQMMESLVSKYSTTASQPGPSQPQPVKNKPKETKQVLGFNSSLALDLNEEAAISTETNVPRLKFSLKNNSEARTEVNNFDENAMDGLEKAPESILWKPICTNENISEKNEKEKIEPASENKNEANSSSKHKKKKKNKDKNKSKEKEKEKKHKKKSEKDKSENDEESVKKKEDKKLKKLLKKQKKKMEKAAAMANTASSCADSSAIASSLTTTIETSQIMLDNTETKAEMEQPNSVQQSPQDLSIKNKKKITNANSTSTPIMPQKTLPIAQTNEPKLPKLKLKLNQNDLTASKSKSNLSHNSAEPVNFSTPQQANSNQRPVSQSAQRANPQQKTARPVNMNQSMPSRDIELGEVVQQKIAQQKTSNNLARHKSQTSVSTPKVQGSDQAKPMAKSHQQTKNMSQQQSQQAKKEAQKARPSTSNNSNQSMTNQFNQIHPDQILFQEALAQEVQNALAQEAFAREAILQEAYNNPQLLPIILPFLQAQNQVMNPQFDLSSLIAQASLQTLTTSQILEAQQLTQQQIAAQYATTSSNPSKKRKTMDMETKSQNTSLNKSQNKPKTSHSLDQSMKRNSVSQHEYVDQDCVNFQQDESGLNPIDEADEYKWHQMRVRQEEESLLEQVQALNMSRLTPVKKNCSFNPNENSTPDAKKKNETIEQNRKNSAMKIIGQVVQETEIASNQYWSCPACDKSDDSAPMIACDSCDDWYHWHCIGLTEEPPENQNWYCHKCGTKRETRNESEVDVESYEPIDAGHHLSNNFLHGPINQPSDYLSNLKIKKKKK